MNEPTSIRNQSCPRPHCRFYGIELQWNVIGHGHKYPRFKCTACGKTWTASRHHIHYRLRHDFKKVQSVIEFLKAGRTIRDTATVAQVSTGTVQRWKKLM